jgi:hypothetical protein
MDQDVRRVLSIPTTIGGSDYLLAKVSFAPLV